MTALGPLGVSGLTSLNEFDHFGVIGRLCVCDESLVEMGPLQGVVLDADEAEDDVCRIGVINVTGFEPWANGYFATS